MLRIHHPRGVRRETEEIGIEFVYAIQQSRTPDVGVAGQRLFADSGGDQLVLRQRDYRLLAPPQVAPERRHGICAGKPPGHAHDRNRVGR